MHQKIGIDLKHAVEFSSFGYTPRQPRQKKLSRPAAGQLHQPYSPNLHTVKTALRTRSYRVVRPPKRPDRLYSFVFTPSNPSDLIRRESEGVDQPFPVIHSTTSRLRPVELYSPFSSAVKLAFRGNYAVDLSVCPPRRTTTSLRGPGSVDGPSGFHANAHSPGQR